MSNPITPAKIRLDAAWIQYIAATALVDGPPSMGDGPGRDAAVEAWESARAELDAAKADRLAELPACYH